MRAETILLAAFLILPACGGASSTGDDFGVQPDGAQADGSTGPSPLGMPGNVTRTMPAFPERLYDVHIPTSYDGITALPVLLNLHGGGGNRANAHKTNCPNGDLASPECLEALADTRGFIIVTPDGTGSPALKDLRTWNAGGGTPDWQCVSAYACNQKIDEAAYFTALLTDLEQVVHFQKGRVFATGFSNGAAMVQRLACELPQLIAGIAPISGGNQYATSQPCTQAKPVIEFHGTADPCWPYAGGAQSCADKGPGKKISIPDTLTGWLTRNACSTTPTDTSLPDTTSDGTTTIRHDYDCTAGSPVTFLEITGGGHQWPNGNPGDNGPTATDFSANRMMLDFFAALP